MDSQFDLSNLNKDLGRLEAVGEQIIKVADRLGDKVDGLTHEQNKQDQRITTLETDRKNDKENLNKKLFWQGVVIAAVTTIFGSIIGAVIAFLLAK